MKLSEHFTLEELTFSQEAIRKGIANEPSQLIITHLRTVAERMEEVRELLGRPIRISSGYRSPELNRAIGGSKASAHIEGWAVDFTCNDFGTPLEICKAIATSGIKFDQLIQEGGWVHISFAILSRKKIMTAHFTDGVVSYTAGLT